MNATVSVVCYKSKKLANGEHPLMIRINQGESRVLKSLGISIKAIHWNFTKGEPKKNCPNKELITKLINQHREEYLNQILVYKTENRSFTPYSLVDKIKREDSHHTVHSFIKEIIQMMRLEKRLGNANAYVSSYNSLKEFAKNLDIPFSDIDFPWLKRYELYLRKRENAENTIGIRFRALRAIYNKAIEMNVVHEKYYPFKKFKISKFSKSTSKRALKKEDIYRIIDLDLKEITTYHSPMLYFSKDMFVFSYLGCGINLIDMAYLKYRDIIDNRVCFERHKTGKSISFQLHGVALDIVNKYKSEHYSLEDYIFPILDKDFHETKQQQHDRIRKVNRKMNLSLKKIGEYLQLSIPLTTYVARHSFATVLKRSGVNIALISEALGHTSLSTTQFYLDSFGNEQIDEAMKNLL
ncbi:site-specific integrase [Bacteroides sp. 51]|uniref:site-specific integrase n=1 Tax=Bacteroides sp. 51 TaxID=2302938 RepID=UPI0013D62129|nr:site-specific integrase [Bacteroides sp. 51]NDV84588.1 site-specific integrase [Bacteroides sp. 51]